VNVLIDQQDVEIRDAVRQFLSAECPTSLARSAENTVQGHSVELWKKFCELGWAGIALATESGGQGLSLTSMGVVMEEVGRHIAPLPFHSTIIPALVLSRHGTAKQKALLPGIASGDTLLSFAVQEGSGEWWPDSAQTIAQRSGEALVLNGRKHFVDGFASSATCMVVVRVISEHGEDEGISCVLVHTNAPGIRNETLAPTAKDSQGVIDFLDVHVSADAIVGGGISAARMLTDYATAFSVSLLEGAARRTMEMAVAYVKQREAFGQAIGAFQVIQHMAADMLNAVDGTQLLVHEAIWLLDHGFPAEVEISQAKAFANEKCLMVARMAQQFHGGIGFIAEFDLNLWYRRITSWALRYGTTYEHRARVARALLDTEGEVRLGMPQFLPEAAV